MKDPLDPTLFATCDEHGYCTRCALAWGTHDSRSPRSDRGHTCPPGFERIDAPARELVELFASASGDRERAEALVADIALQAKTLPRCFTLKGGTAAQTARAHELARLLAAN